MDPDFWLERWQQSQIGFHQADTEPLLQKHWPSLNLPAGSTVFVPLCGKSLDMVWLAGQGHKIIGIELSEIAVDDFFASQDLTPQTRSEPNFTIKTAGPYELWCGDIFSMPTIALQGIAGTYDRAALVALPPDMRKRYAQRLIELNQDTAQTLLITFEYDQSILPGPPHSVPRDEVDALFAACQITEVAREQTRARSPKFKEHGLETVGQAVYILAPKQNTNA